MIRVVSSLEAECWTVTALVSCITTTPLASPLPHSHHHYPAGITTTPLTSPLPHSHHHYHTHITATLLTSPLPHWHHHCHDLTTTDGLQQPGDSQTENFWYGALAALNSAIPHAGQELTPPGLYGPWVTQDNPGWHGDFTIGAWVG